MTEIKIKKASHFNKYFPKEKGKKERPLTAAKKKISRINGGLVRGFCVYAAKFAAGC